MNILSKAVNKSSAKPSIKRQHNKITCTYCEEPKLKTEFYMSYSPLHSLEQRVPICKECCKKFPLNKDGTIDYEKLNILLRSIDKPLYYDILYSAERNVRAENSYTTEKELQLHGYAILSKYFLIIQTVNNRKRSYTDSEKDGFIHPDCDREPEEIDFIRSKYIDYTNNNSLNNVSNITSLKSYKNEDSEESVPTFDEKSFKVTQDIVNLFGDGYSPIEYRKMSKKYNEMSQTYVIQTSIHKEALVTYVRFKVKEEMATARGDVQEAQKWYSAAQSAAEQGKLTAKSISKEDLQGGIVNFSDIFKVVEGAKERIKIFPEFKYQPKDAADFIIWCYVNYERNLNNMPEVEYKDIYHFYDEKKREYIEQYGDPYGIFTDDTTESNRDTIEKFITIPPEFRDGS